MGNEQINKSLKDHEKSVEDWAYKEHARFLHEWTDLFNLEFKLRIETPAIAIERIGTRILGIYRRGRNGFGVRHEVTLNLKHLERPVGFLLETLLHELLHEWQTLYGRPGRANYHNKQYRDKARSYGLMVGSGWPFPWYSSRSFYSTARTAKGEHLSVAFTIPALKRDKTSSEQQNEEMVLWLHKYPRGGDCKSKMFVVRWNFQTCRSCMVAG